MQSEVGFHASTRRAMDAARRWSLRARHDIAGPGKVSQMADDRWWRQFDAVVAAALPAGARVLDLGCGDGGLVDRLTEPGFDAHGVDPHAPNHPRLTRESIEEATGLAAFDAVTAVMALHHVELATRSPLVSSRQSKSDVPTSHACLRAPISRRRAGFD